MNTFGFEVQCGTTFDICSCSQ